MKRKKVYTFIPKSGHRDCCCVIVDYDDDVFSSSNFYHLTTGESKITRHWVALLDTWQLRLFQTTEGVSTHTILRPRIHTSDEAVPFFPQE